MHARTVLLYVHVSVVEPVGLAISHVSVKQNGQDRQQYPGDTATKSNGDVTPDTIATKTSITISIYLYERGLKMPQTVFSRMRSEGFPFIVGGLGVGPVFAASWSARRFRDVFRVVFATFFASLIQCL